MNHKQRAVAFFFVYCGAKFVLRKTLTFGSIRVTIQTTKNTSDAAEAAFGVFCLTTVYPTSMHGVHGNSGGKMAGKHPFPSGKGRKRPEISGKRYSGFLWDDVPKMTNLGEVKIKRSLFLAVFDDLVFIRTLLFAAVISIYMFTAQVFHTNDDSKNTTSYTNDDQRL